MRRRSARIAVIVVAVLVLGACARGSQEEASVAPAGNAVAIKTFMFRPSPTRVPAGATVTWTNEDDIAHTITAGEPDAPEETFDSGDRVLGETFSFEFTEKGTFPYFCSRHPSMRGEVVVT